MSRSMGGSRLRSVAGSGRVRARRLVGVAGLVLVLVAGLVSVLPPHPAAVANAAVGGSGDRSVPVSAVGVSGVDGVAPPVWVAPAVVWPVAGSVVVELVAGRGEASVGGLPVTVTAVPVEGLGTEVVVSSVRVEVVDRVVAGSVGVALVVRVSRADGESGLARVTVGLGYAGFRHGFGGDWGGRLRLVGLAGCAVLSPEVEECRLREGLGSSNEVAAGVVSAQVDVGGVTSADIAAVGGDVGDGSVLLGLMSGGSGETGDFGQTSLTQSASWQAGGSSGDFSWSYPVGVAPVPGGLVPSVRLGYSSGAVDGQTANNNTQPGWIGEGFSYEPGFIERAYRPCGQDDTVTPVWPNSTDLCWRMANARLMWNGRATALVPEDASSPPNTAMPTVWHLADDDGTKVEYLTGGGSSVTSWWGNERWKLTTKDGTQFYFGMSRVPGSTVATNSVLGEPVLSNSAGEPCFSAVSEASSWCSMAYRWNLDYVVDRHGNSMVFYYTKETNLAKQPGSVNGTVSYDRAAVPHRIEYGLRAGAEATSTAPARVVFNTGDRCFTVSCGTHDGTNWPDTPWDLQCTAGPCESPTFWSTKRLVSISVQVWTGTGTTYRNVDFYDLPGQFRRWMIRSRRCCG